MLMSKKQFSEFKLSAQEKSAPEHKKTVKRARTLDTSLGDVCTLASIFRTIPLSTVLDTLAAESVFNQRERDLPHWLMTYYVAAMALYPSSNYVAVAEKLAASYKQINGPLSELKIPSSGALTMARQRLPWQVIQRLFQTVSVPITTEATPGAFYHHLRLQSFDGSTIDLPDSAENGESYGYPSNALGRGAFPQLRCVTLVENGSRAVIDFEEGPGDKRSSEIKLARPIIERLKSGTLNMADRLFPGKELWDLGISKGAHLLWRVKSDVRLDIDQELPDGSYLSRFCGHSDCKGKKRKNGTLVRVIAYKIPGKNETFRLITSLLDADAYPAEELARLYPQRWDVETVYKDLKFTLPEGKQIIRSKSPEMVKQEIYGMLLAHRAIRVTMLDAAVYGNVHPDSISLRRTVEVIKSNLPEFGKFSP